MTFRYRPELQAEHQLRELERTLGIQNLKDVQVDEDNLLLYIFTETKKFSVALTLVP